MSLEIKHDSMNRPYVEGNVGKTYIIGEPCRDLITGQPYGKIKANDMEYQIERAIDPLTGETHYPVKAVGNSSSGSCGGGGGALVFLLGILLIPVAIYLPLLIWKWIVDENIPELLAVSIGSVGFTAFFMLRNPVDFSIALGTSIFCISLLFIIFASILMFVIPIPAMAAKFSIGTLAGIGLIGFIASLAPSFIIAVLSGTANHFRNKHKRGM